MTTKLTKKQKKEYLLAYGNECPFCKSTEISGGTFESDYNQAWRIVECEECGKTWEDIYTLTDLETK